MMTFTKENYFHLHYLQSGIKPNVIYQFARGGLNRNLSYYGIQAILDSIDFYNAYKQEYMKNEYRKFIEESKYARIGVRKPLSIPRVQCAKSNRNII